MKILVIDDKPIHQESARQTLVGHELTIARTYDEAHELLQEPRASHEAVVAELKRRGFKYPCASDDLEEEIIARSAELKRIEREFCPPPPFEVVLCDLLMPASRMKMAGEGLKYVGQEMPVGFALSLMAALQGAKYVAVATDTNHHHHPCSAMLDAFASQCPREYLSSAGVSPRFVINGAKVGYYHSPMRAVDGFDKQWGKDWAKVLAHLIA